MSKNRTRKPLYQLPFAHLANALHAHSLGAPESTVQFILQNGGWLRQEQPRKIQGAA